MVPKIGTGTILLAAGGVQFTGQSYLKAVPRVCTLGF